MNRQIKSILFLFIRCDDRTKYFSGTTHSKYTLTIQNEFPPIFLRSKYMNIVNVGYDSTNYYILDAKSGKLLIDCGWPGTLPKLSVELKRKGISLQDVRHLFVTHFHPDHAGLTQELKNLGAKLILLETQRDFIAELTEFFKGKKYPYVEINPDDNLQLGFEQSRAFLARLGIDGEILSTPGHSDDSVTLILDEGFAFTGDLPPRFMIAEDNVIAKKSWDRIYQHQIVRIFPAHGNYSIHK